MPYFDIKVRVEARVRLTSHQPVTIEARDAEEAARLACEAGHVLDLAGKSVRRLQDGREFAEVAVDSADGQIARIAEADFRAFSPEHRLLGDYKELLAVEGRGVSNGHVVLWTEPAASLVDRTIRSVPLPDDLRALLARYEGGEQAGRHPGLFASRYVTTVRQMYCVLLGDSAGNPALIVEVATRRCVGFLMPMRVDADTAANSTALGEPAPELPEGWASGKPPREAPFHFSPQGTLFPGR